MSGIGAIWECGRNAHLEEEFVERHGHVNEIAVGTVLEYDDWQWCVVSEIASDRDEPMFGFILVDEVSDDIIKRLEQANGCRQHYEAVQHLRDTDDERWAPVEYILTDDIWTVLAPVHPDHRTGSDEESTEADGAGA